MLGVGDGDERGQRSPQFQQRVQLHRRIGAGPVGPRTKRDAQVDQRGVQGIDRCIEIERVRFVCVELARPRHQPVREVGEESPVPLLVGVGQGAACHPRAEPEMVGQSRLRPETGLDVTQALAKGHLGEPQRQEVFPRVELQPCEAWSWRCASRWNNQYGTTSTICEKTVRPTCIGRQQHP